ncbi:MAG: hypothetical protein GY719_14185 [bacterium]|nr:hypothetical protein [bacterium]
MKKTTRFDLGEIRGLALSVVLLAGVSPAAGATVTDPSGRSPADLAMENFLRHAEVVETEEVGEGITRPRRLTLRRGGVVHRAIFKTIDQETAGTAVVNRIRREYSDKYVYEVAAYRLDRLVGIGLVPVTVIRTIDGETGSVQLWIEDVRTLEEVMKDADTAVGNSDLLIERLGLMYILDALIYNADRNFGNILINVDRDVFHPIDHSRTFWLLPTPPPSARGSVESFSVPAHVEQRLRGIDFETLDRLVGDLLEDRQVKAVLKRRDRLLKLLGNRPA